MIVLVRTRASLTAATKALVPLVGMLNASGDAVMQAQGLAIRARIKSALADAANLDNADVVTLLRDSLRASSDLRAFDRGAKTAASKIAGESKLAEATSFLISASIFVGAVATGNAAAAASQLSSMLGALGVT